MAVDKWKRQNTVRCVCPHCEKSVVETTRSKLFKTGTLARYLGTCTKCRRDFRVEVDPAPEDDYVGLSTGDE